MKNNDNLIGIYIHIPFCEKKCPYCDFYSLPSDESLIDEYVKAVCFSIERWSKTLSKTVDTLYFGGGTPSLIGEKRLSRIVEIVSKNFHLQSPEITIEANPTKGKLLDFKYLKNSGINRLSVGLQSANENELKILGRSHNKEDAKLLIDSAQKSGIYNISLDLMLAIPFQTLASLKNSIDFCASRNVTHISAYLLKIEKGTKFYQNKSHLNLPDEEETVNLYLSACEELENHGFKQYEISNFSLPQKESKHNLKYWNCEEYLGIGPSAHSFISGKRFYYENSIEKFINGDLPVSDGFGGNEYEYSMLKLRLSEGITNKQFNKRFSRNIPKSFFQNASKYEKSGLVICTSDSIKLTKKGFLVSNELIYEILS